MKKTIAAALAMLLLLSGCTRKQTPLSAVNQVQGEGTAVGAEGALASPPTQDSAAGADVELVVTDGATDHGELFQRPDGDYIEINEKVFVAQTNDIYLNAEDYVGKTIRYEGIYKNEYWDSDENEIVHYVVRYGPGCCGFDQNAGFEVNWDGGYPQVDDWVEVIGTVEIYEFNGWPYLVVEVQSLTVMQERGQEYVYM